MLDSFSWVIEQSHTNHWPNKSFEDYSYVSLAWKVPWDLSRDVPYLITIWTYIFKEFVHVYEDKSM